MPKDKDSDQIQQICEKFFSSEMFLKKLAELITSQIPALVEATIKEYSEKVVSLEDKMDNIEQKLKCNNLRIYGLPTKRNINDSQHFISTINKYLNMTLTDNDIDCIYRLPQNNNALLVKLRYYDLRDYIYRNKRKLKGSKVVVTEDLTARRYKLYSEVVKLTGKTNTWTAGGIIKSKIDDKVYKIKNASDLGNLPRQIN